MLYLLRTINHSYLLNTNNDTVSSFLQVCTNGMLTVGTPPLFLGTALERFPTADTRISQSNLLAPFWNDHDGRDPASSVTYRVYGGAASDPEGFMSPVSSFISSQIDSDIVGKFEPTWMLVASWNYVPPYPHTATERGQVSAVCVCEWVCVLYRQPITFM